MAFLTLFYGFCCTNIQNSGEVFLAAVLPHSFYL